MARIHIIATSFNRPQSALRLLNDIEAEAGSHAISVTLYDDASPVDYGEVRDKMNKPGWTYLRPNRNHGKRHYCDLCMGAFKEAHKVSADFYLFIQDDMRLCHDFFTRAVAMWEAIQDPRKTTLYLFKDPAAGSTRWTGIPPVPQGPVDKMGWVDCACFLFKRQFLDTMVGGMIPPTDRWFANPEHGSGTGRQMSILLHRAGMSMYRTSKSLVVHTHVTSEMNTALRKKQPMPTTDFIDGMEKANELARQDAVTVSLAAIPSRKAALADVVKRLLPQVDHLNVFLNGFGTVPPFLKNTKISVARSEDHRDHGDAGKFFWADQVVGYHLTCDDDLAYPPDYVRKLILGIESYRKQAVVGTHGALLKEPVQDYYQSRKLFHYRIALDRPVPVHVLGTGTVAYHTSTIKVSYSDFREPNMADIWFALLGQKQGVPFMVLPRSAGWLTDIPQTADVSIYAESQRGTGTVKDTRQIQTNTVQSHSPWQTFDEGLAKQAIRKAAFLVPTMRRPDLLRACLASLAKQEVPKGWSYEVLVSGPPDDPGKAVVKEFGYTYVQTLLPYAGGKLNVCAMETDAELLLEADDDDLQSPLRLKAAVEARRAGSQWSSCSLVRFLDLGSGQVAEWAGQEALVGTTMTLTRTLWDRLGGWPSVARGKEGLLTRRVDKLGDAGLCRDLGAEVGRATICFQHPENIWTRPFPDKGAVKHKGSFEIRGLGSYEEALTIEQKLLVKGLVK